MADLKTTLKNASQEGPTGLQSTLMTGMKSSPTLGRTSNEELQKLAAKSGRPLPPTDPTTAQQLGASPQQAAMAGSSANLKSTLQMAASSDAAPTTLQDTLRTEQARTQKSAAELEQEQLAERLQAGTQQATSEDVGTAAQGKFANMSTDEIQLKLTEEFSYLNDEATPEQQKTLAKALSGQSLSNDELTALASVPGPDGEPIVSFSDDANTMAENISGLFGGEAEAVMAAAAGAVEDYDDFNVQDFYVDEEGNVDEQAISELAAALGMTEEEVSTMNLGDIQSTLAANIEEEYSRTENLQSVASNKNMSPMERAQARKALRDAGATGVIALEQGDMDAIADSVANADTINIGGKDITIEELLSDDYISGLVSNYLEDAEGAEEAIAELGEGGLKSFVDENRAALEQMSQDIDDSAKGWAGVQTHNKSEIADLTRVVGDEAAQWLASQAGMEGLTNFSSGKIEIPILDQPKLVNEVLPGLENQSILQQFLGADSATLDKWKFMPSEKIQQFKESSNFSKSLGEAMEAGLSSQQLIDTFMPGINVDTLRKKRDLVLKGLLPVSDQELRTINTFLNENGELRPELGDRLMGMAANNIGDIDRGDIITPSSLDSGMRFSEQSTGSLGRRVMENGGLGTDGYLNPQAYGDFSVQDLEALASKGVGIRKDRIPQDKIEAVVRERQPEINSFIESKGLNAEDPSSEAVRLIGEMNGFMNNYEDILKRSSAGNNVAWANQYIKEFENHMIPQIRNQLLSIEEASAELKRGGGPMAGGGLTSNLVEDNIQEKLRGAKGAIGPAVKAMLDRGIISKDNPIYFAVKKWYG